MGAVRKEIDMLRVVKGALMGPLAHTYQKLAQYEIKLIGPNALCFTRGAAPYTFSVFFPPKFIPSGSSSVWFLQHNWCTNGWKKGYGNISQKQVYKSLVVPIFHLNLSNDFTGRARTGTVIWNK